MTHDKDGAWFSAKRYGYGAGPPVAWQGWAVLIGYLALVLGIGRVLPTHRAVAVAIIVIATGLLIVLAARHTRGGWRWRWGGE